MEVDILKLIDMKYILCTIISTYIILSYGIKHVSTLRKYISYFLIGCTFGTIWYFILHISIDTLILSFLISLIGYHKIITPILKQFGVTHRNGKGLIR